MYRAGTGLAVTLGQTLESDDRGNCEEWACSRGSDQGREMQLSSASKVMGKSKPQEPARDGAENQTNIFSCGFSYSPADPGLKKGG